MQHQMTKGTVGPQTPPDLPEGIPMHEEIAALAHSLWQARGCPAGTPDEDWFNAEKALTVKAEE